MSLTLGPTATAEDLLKRDEVFWQVARLDDPNVREDLLRLLENRERPHDTTTIP